MFTGVFIFGPKSGYIFGATTSSTTTPACAAVVSRNLKIGSVGTAVRELQRFLNLFPDTVVGIVGVGSKGHESTYFGYQTAAAVARFQQKFAPEILAPSKLTKGTGFVGTSTRNKIMKVCSTLSTTTAASVAVGGGARWSSAPPANQVLSTVSRGGGGGGAAPAAPSQSTTTSVTPVSGPSPAPTSTVTTSVSTTSTATSTAIATSTTVPPVIVPITKSGLIWGAYIGDGQNDLASFETLVGKAVNIQAVFVGFQDSFPSSYASTVGAKGKTLLIFWEPSVSYDAITNGSQDKSIMKFVIDASSYGYPVILVPFNEMNLNEEVWGYGVNGNTSTKFIAAWKHVHDLFAAASNVKFAIDFNNESVPDVAGNRFSDYYPGDSYVDYVGVDGFNFGNPWQSFSAIFDSAISKANAFGKPEFIFSVASAEGPQKAAWITDGLGTRIHTYQNVKGWVWFNQNKEQNWLVNSDTAALNAFKAVLR